MANRRTKTKTTSPKKAKRRQTRAQVERVLTGPVRKKNGPRSQTLPGMEQVRRGALDNICEGIHDCRQQKNAALVEEGRLDVSALQFMVREQIVVYRHAGIELARIPGAEKLRVRVTKETGDAAAGDLEKPSPAEDQEEVPA